MFSERPLTQFEDRMSVGLVFFWSHRVFVVVVVVVNSHSGRITLFECEKLGNDVTFFQRLLFLRQ